MLTSNKGIDWHIELPPWIGYSKISILSFLNLINKQGIKQVVSFECLSLREDEDSDIKTSRLTERERERERISVKKPPKLWQRIFRDSKLDFR